jgi:hypothetical protein
MSHGKVYDKTRLLAADTYSWARLSLVGSCFVVNERLGYRRLHEKSFGQLTKGRHLEEVILFHTQIFSDFDIFSDTARYFSMAVMTGRILQKRRLFEVVEEMFAASLFSEPEFYSESFHSLRPKLLSIVLEVLDSFYYDFSEFQGRKLLKTNDKIVYQQLINGK